jgi:hypothetical protein
MISNKPLPLRPFRLQGIRTIEKVRAAIVRLNVRGSRKYTKVSYPARYGCLNEIITPGHHFQFNQNGEIKFLQGLGRDWPHPAEWLKRTAGNQWVYYDTAGYNHLFDFLGEYYLPCFEYDSNSLWGNNPFQIAAVQETLAAFKALSAELPTLLAKGTWSPEEQGFLAQVASKNPQTLSERAAQLTAMLEGQVTVLPPDTRHVDYECLPLIIADGCLYHCAFCRVKSAQDFRVRSQREIRTQLNGIKSFYGSDLRNYNSLFLGLHDALNCGRERIISSALEAYDFLELERSYLEGSFLFLFGSVDSFLKAEERLFEELNQLPFYTYLNLGLESADQETLNLLGKPLEVSKVKEAFNRMLALNREYDRLEITANFVINLQLPQGHWESLERLTHDGLPHYLEKGAVYLSPLSQEGRAELRRRFQKLKFRSRLPLYLYLIQQL